MAPLMAPQSSWLGTLTGHDFVQLPAQQVMTVHVAVDAEQNG